MTEWLSGRLLVAAPSLRDPNFDRTVVLVIEHAEEGALGLVLNRPSETDLAAALPRWEAVAAQPPVVFVGGPVAPTAAIGLAPAPVGEEVEGWRHLFAGIGSIDLEQDPDELAIPVSHVRVFAGYAGWSPGQLEAEVDAGAWYVVDALPGDARCERPEDLWSAVLRRQGGALAVVANFPPDPGMN
ncbi:MAG TPA: YqgE/AlgH family protein [Acidimicrobiales bacterium]|nr:YqgE/AlgH family protein [Acidimicrobiales bacterium]